MTDINAEMLVALKDVRDNGLIYWQPMTERGQVQRARMMKRLDDLIAKADAARASAQSSPPLDREGIRAEAFREAADRVRSLFNDSIVPRIRGPEVVAAVLSLAQPKETTK